MKQSGFQFTNPMISKLNYLIHPDFKPAKNEAVSIENSFATNIYRDPDENAAVVELIIMLGDIKPDKAPFHIELTIGASFKWEQAYTEETITSLLSVNAPAVLLGYARPIIATITNMSPYHAYNVPFYNFTNNSI